MAVQGVTRLQAKIRSKQQRQDLIAGARDDFLAICRRLDEGAPPEIAARPRWPGPGLCAPTFAPLVYGGIHKKYLLHSSRRCLHGLVGSRELLMTC